MMTHHSVMTSSLHNYNSKTDLFRDVFDLIINQYVPRHPKDSSGGHKLCASRAAQTRDARL